MALGSYKGFRYGVEQDKLKIYGSDGRTLLKEYPWGASHTDPAEIHRVATGRIDMDFDELSRNEIDKDS